MGKGYPASMFREKLSQYVPEKYWYFRIKITSKNGQISVQELCFYQRISLESK
jgi:hypothetical protein